MTEGCKNTNGFAINSWSSLVSFMSVCIMAIGGIAWGLKLEAKSDKQLDQIISTREKSLADIEKLSSVTELKLKSIDDKVFKLEQSIDACKKQIGK